MRLFGAYFRRIVTTPLFYISIVTVAALCLYGAQTEAGLHVVDTFDVVIHISTYRNLIVLAATMPISTLYCRECNNKVHSGIIIRSSSSSNLFNYISVSAIFSFVTAFLGMWLCILIMTVTYPSFIDPVNVYQGVFQHLRTPDTAVLFLLILTYHYSISISAWSIAGLAMSAVFTDPYVAVCSPLVLSYLFEMLTIRIGFLPNLWYLSLSNTRISDVPIIASGYITFVFAFVGVTFAVIFYHFAKRRAECEIV